MEIAGLVRRVEASTTTAVPVLAWLLLGPPLAGWVFPLDRIFTMLGLTALPDWVKLASVWSLAAVWVVLDGSIKRFNCHLRMNEKDPEPYKRQRRATYGMRVRGLEFRSIDGAYITFGRCAGRIVLGILALPLVPISLFLALTDPERRTIADRLCGTVVCVSPSDDDGYCRRCGYNLAGLQESRCPECGTAFEPKPDDSP